MSKVTRREWYRRVNAAWPAHVPALTADEATRAARKLYRFAMGHTWRGEIRVTSGRRYTWIRHGILFVNPGHGWHGLVHLLSHYCHDRTDPDAHGHNAAHARAELRMIKEVVRRRWLDGRLRTPEPTPIAAPSAADVRLDRKQRIEASIKRWETKAKRAATALRKLHRRLRAIERSIERDASAAVVAPESIAA